MAQRICCAIWELQHPAHRLQEFLHASKAARAAGSRRALFMLSQAAYQYGTELLIRLLAGPGGERIRAQGRGIVLVAEARSYLELAATCAWAGAECDSALCAAYFVEVLGRVGAVNSHAAEFQLRKLAEAVKLPENFSDPLADLPPAEARAEDDEVRPKLAWGAGIIALYCGTYFLQLLVQRLQGGADVVRA